MENKDEFKNVNENVMPNKDSQNVPPIDLPEEKTQSSEQANAQQPDSQEPKQESKVEQPAENNNGKTAEEQMNQQLEKPKSRPIKNPDAFNSSEKVLYEIKEEKQGSPIVVVILFALLITFILCLPSINSYVQKKFGPQYTRKTTPVAEKEENVEELKNKFHDATNRVTIGDIDIFQVGTIQVNDEYFATFTIFNNADVTYTYDKKYYLVLYEEDRVLYRSLIHSYNPIAAYGSDEIRLVINQNAFNNADNFKLEEINTSLYPDVKITNKEEDYMVLTCNYKEDTIKYYFKDNMLEKINESYNVSINNPNYAALESEFNTKSATYNNMTGIESIFYNRQDGFEMINNLNLAEIQDIDLTNLKVYRYFKFRENSKIVSFELTSMGYTCG